MGSYEQWFVTDFKFLFLDYRFICKNNGVLFENDLLQIGVKTEFRANLGRLGIFYGNKTSFQFTGFQVDVHVAEELQTHILYTSRVLCPSFRPQLTPTRKQTLFCPLYNGKPSLNWTPMGQNCPERTCFGLNRFDFDTYYEKGRQESVRLQTFPYYTHVGLGRLITR